MRCRKDYVNISVVYTESLGMGRSLSSNFWEKMQGDRLVPSMWDHIENAFSVHSLVACICREDCLGFLICDL